MPTFRPSSPPFNRRWRSGWLAVRDVMLCIALLAGGGWVVWATLGGEPVSVARPGSTIGGDALGPMPVTVPIIGRPAPAAGTPGVAAGPAGPIARSPVPSPGLMPALVPVATPSPSASAVGPAAVDATVGGALAPVPLRLAVAPPPVQPMAVPLTITPMAVPGDTTFAGRSFQYGDANDPMVIAMHPSAKYRSDGTAYDGSIGDDPSLVRENLRLENARRFVMSMCRDHEGRLWIGCENEQPGDGTGGVQCFDPSSPPLHQWTQYTIKDGLGDDNGYAIACDKQDRIWVGHLNHGVSVFNHNSKGHWQCYEVVAGLSRPDTLSGPIGERVFAIKCCPTDGDVWIATNCGLSRYSESRDAWTYFTRVDGLPSDQSNAITFDHNGNIYVGTQCDGIAMADANNNYKTWRTAAGPDEEPATPTGEGLPTNLINDVLVANDGTVYAATDAGLAWSMDAGTTWRFIRGREWADKVRGRIGGPPPGWAEPAMPGDVLAEDYCTSLAEDSSGQLWVGHRAAPIEPRSAARPMARRGLMQSKALYVTSMLVADEPSPLAGTYDSGVSSRAAAAWTSALKFVRQDVPLPAGVPSLTREQLNAELAKLAAVPQAAASSPNIVALDDDWSTQGDWLGHYGRYWCVLSAMDGDGGYQWGASPDALPFSIGLGCGARTTDFVRYWTYAYYTTARRSLEIPPIYFHSRVLRGLTTWDVDRRQVEWDDHGETYPIAAEGPGFRLNLTVPNGTFIISLYEINPDGHDGRNRLRDYGVSASVTSPRSGAATPESADHVCARVVSFWDGVYKRFLVRGPADILLTIDRNHSYNTKISALMVDVPTNQMIGYDMTASQWMMREEGEVNRRRLTYTSWQADPAQQARAFAPCINYRSATENLLDGLDLLREWNPKWAAWNERRLAVFLCRSAAGAGSAAASLRVRCFLAASLFDGWDHNKIEAGHATQRQMEKRLRWDGISADDSGREYEDLMRHRQR